MLALTRKKGEALVINNNIEITVLEIRGDQIKIGISAPKDVPIYRKEVYLQIQQENEAAISADGLDDMNKIGNYIKEERKKAGLTQEEFAMRSGLGLRFVRELEQGKETVRMDKVNQALAMFGKEAVPGEKEE